MTAVQNRNITLDYFKLLLAALVVLIHLHYGDKEAYNWFVQNGLGRIAVPCFFVINGYFFSKIVDSSHKVKKYVARLLTIYIAWMLIYFGFYRADLSPLFQIDETNIFVLLFRGYFHLWYLAALIGASVIIYFVRKVNVNLLLGVAILLALFACFMGKLFFFGNLHEVILPSLSRSNIQFLTDSFLFMGFPFVMFGFYIEKKKITLEKVNKNLLLGLIILLIGILLVEAYMTHTIAAQKSLDGGINLHFSLLLLCPLLFIYVMRISVHKPDDGYVAKLSTGIYLVHILIIVLLPARSTFIYFPFVYFLALIASVGIIEINKRLRFFL